METHTHHPHIDAFSLTLSSDDIPMLLVTRLNDNIIPLLVKGLLLLFLLGYEFVVMGVSELCGEGIINDFGLSLGYILVNIGSLIT